MDPQILLAIILFALTVIWIWMNKSSCKTQQGKLPPGPWKLPLIGNMHHFIGSLPHRCLRDLANRHGPVMPYLPAARILFYDFTDIGFAPYGDYWRQLRKICTLEQLRAKRVQSFRAIREEEEAVEIVGGFSLADAFPSFKLLQILSGRSFQLEKLHRKSDKILENIIQQHRADRSNTKSGDKDEQNDLVHVLLNLLEHGNLEIPLTDSNIKAVVQTTSMTIEWAMSEMLKYPKILEEAQAEVRHVFNKRGEVNEEGLSELKYLKLVMKETLRLHPALPLLLPRESKENCKINGYEIPAKSRVIINGWAIGRDPKYWTEAEKFNPERFLNSWIEFKGVNFEYIPFGAGRRICPGIAFGMANVELPIAQLLYYFDWKLGDGRKMEELNMDEVFGATVAKKHELCVVPIPYHSGAH
ncbi:putative Cytochrome P450 71D10 [Hibiscus syriacus]|uniref:Cytochrome P450 71D10 n=1 Tax=Hibiscus syriacus TaxID=106335 RepID=A0A6A2YLV4_HIBSY|nr:putative Cytochrome P450 71D10 [Hibiscus syriacus]